MKRKIILWMMMVLLLSGLVACGEKKEAEEKTPLQKEKVTVILDWVPNTNHTGLYAALEEGYYEEEGLEVEIIQPTEGGSADLIAAGQGQFGISYQEQVTYARTAENPLPVVAIYAILPHNTSGFASRKEAGIESPKDFEGKKYGGWGSPMEEAVLRGLMDKAGADYEKLEIVDIGALDFFEATQSHVDFTWIYYGWDGVAAEQKGVALNFIKLQDFESHLDFYTPVIIANEKTLKEKPALAEKFIRATQKGYQLAVDEPEKAAQALLKHAPESDGDLVLASAKYLAKLYREEGLRLGEMKKEMWENYANWMYEKNLIQKPLEVEGAYTNDYLPK